MIDVKIILKEGAKMPIRGTELSAGWDICANLSDVPRGLYGIDEHGVKYVELKPNGRKLFNTGISFELPKFIWAGVYSKSGLALKHGIIVLNSPGVIDADYTGDIGVILHNTGHCAYRVKDGDRIAQLIFSVHETPNFVQAVALTATDRGEGGFGSTGTN